MFKKQKDRSRTPILRPSIGQDIQIQRRINPRMARSHANFVNVSKTKKKTKQQQKHKKYRKMNFSSPKNISQYGFNTLQKPITPIQRHKIHKKEASVCVLQSFMSKNNRQKQAEKIQKSASQGRMKTRMGRLRLNHIKNTNSKIIQTQIFKTNSIHKSATSNTQTQKIQGPITKNENKIQILEEAVETYYNMYLSTQKKLQSAQQQVKNEEKRRQRECKLYKQRIKDLLMNKTETKNYTIDHLYTYNDPPQDYIPDSIIVQNSHQLSSQKKTINPIDSTNPIESQISSLSLNSN